MAMHGQRGKSRHNAKGHKMGRHTGTGHSTLNTGSKRSGRKASHLNPKARSFGSKTSGPRTSGRR